jgi:adenylate cyclase
VVLLAGGLSCDNVYVNTLKKAIERGMTQRASFWGLLLRFVVFVTGAYSLEFLLDPPHSPEHWSSDMVTARFSKTARGQNPDLVLVYISETTLANIPYLSPIDRGMLADLISAIDQAGAKVIGLDLILDRQTEPEKDHKLINSIKQARGKLVLGIVEGPAKFQSDMLEELGLGRECESVNKDSRINCGHVYLGADPSNLVLSGYVVRFIEDTGVFKSFGSAVAAAASGKIYPTQSRIISWLLPPRDSTDLFTTFDARTLPGDGPLAHDIKKLINGKIVLIGGNFKDRDRHIIPLSITDGKLYPGLFIHAQFIAQILDGRYVNEPSLWIAFWILLPISLIAFKLGQRSDHRHLWLELGGIVCLGMITVALFIVVHFIFPLAYAAFAWIVPAAVGHYGFPVEKSRSG